ncbi:ribonuclease M5 [Tetragenococcus muriaticus]|uniref:Ribonuclease M5 n=1 Tax=Tetragenococcus muriaticus 3MR10-3 TaxID=1302648 RepID=A0A091C4C6_9ENTE|nr:ribonuclease M5 [Tetragenococcus muriaticus]KFN92706.1 ribonuclease M5 [Tetragenococcus muriaticus 3MR10-3]
MKEKVEEIIVVEGKEDTRRLQEVLPVDTIETIGSAINEEIIERIIHAQERRGVIVFTDPDYSGEKIRKIIMEEVPDAKHAFLPRHQARGKKKYASLGVEHASDEAILTALEQVVTPAVENDLAKISRQTLLNYGLIYGSQAKRRRELLGDELRIGYTNGKQLEKRLAMFRITPEALEKAMGHVEENL